MTRILLISFFLMLAGAVSAQFIDVPPQADGSILTGEYGNANNQASTGIASSINWYCTWDADSIYFAISGSNVFEAALIYIDADPQPLVNAGNSNGSTNWSGDYDSNDIQAPIRSDFKLYAKRGYNEYRYADGAGDWSAPTSNAISYGDATSPSVMEFAVPWNVVTQGQGRPSSFNWFAYKTYFYAAGSNGVYAPMPAVNPTVPQNAGFGQVNALYPTYYYSVVNTDNLTSTPPFAALSFTYHEDKSAAFTGGYILGSQTLFDLTVYDGSTDNLDNDYPYDGYDNLEIANRLLIDGDVIINRHLYVGIGSALLPADNSGGPINSTITMNGSTAMLTIEGRLDCSPEVGSVADAAARRLGFVFDGNVVIGASSVFKDRARFGDITINPGKTLLAPLGGTAQLELQYGTMTNHGILDLWNFGLGTVSMDTRGDSPSLNTYYLSNPSGTGVFRLDDLLIGRDSSALSPALNGGVVELLVHGDFSNYHEFIPKTTGGQIDVVMEGIVRQHIIGNVTETVDARTTFGRLVIDNNNLQANGNAGADVHFISYGGGEIDYSVKDELMLVSGDLVTRDHSDPSLVHEVIIDSSATIDYTLATSGDAILASSMVDGPLTRVRMPGEDSLNFPIGKEDGLRISTLVVERATYAADTLTMELYREDAESLGNSTPTSPELITGLSSMRYWTASGVLQPGYTDLSLGLSFDAAGAGDGITTGADIRLLRAAAGGGTAWENVNPMTGTTGSASGTGTIFASGLTGLGDFTFGDVGNNPLPVELISYDARAIGQDAILTWSTASEINSSHYTLLHSRDADRFEPLVDISAAGFSSQLQEYAYTHSKVGEGTHYYRLMQYDMDGTYENLGVQVVIIGDSQDALIYPNPFHSTAQIMHPNDWQGHQYRIYDMAGRVIEQGQLSAGNTRIGPSISSGNYTLEVVSDQKLLSYRITRY